MDALKFLNMVDRISAKWTTEEKAQYNEYRENRDNASAIAFVVKWDAEHPVKTRQSEFLKLFPGAAPTKDGVLSICPNAFSPVYKDERGLCKWHYADCDNCCRQFWSAEVEE